jgi:hypothetical protein
MAKAGPLAACTFPQARVNRLGMGERRKRRSAQSGSAFGALVEALRTMIDAETPIRAWSDIRHLSLRHDILAYEAACLE